MTQRNSYLLHNINWMRTICLWPLETKSTVMLFLNTLYTALMVIILAVVSIGQVIEIFVSPNISSMASAVDLATLTASALFKMVYIIFYRKDFQALVNKIDSTFVESDFSIGTFHMSHWLKNSRRFTNIYISMGAACLLPFFVVAPYLSVHFPVLNANPFETSHFEDFHYHVNKSLTSFLSDPNQPKMQEDSSNIGNHSTLNISLIVSSYYENDSFIKHEKVLKNMSKSNVRRKFPFNCWFPFDVTWSPLYEIVFLLETLALVGSGHIYLVSDSFFFMIMFLACGQLELLKVSLRGMEEKYEPFTSETPESRMLPDSKGRLSPVVWELYSRENNLNKAVFKCVDFHNGILEIVRDLDLMLRTMIVVDFLHAVISLSFAMLQTITAGIFYEWIQMILFIGICILHQFLNNYFCEILIQQQLSVAEAVYDLPWVDGSEGLKTAVYMTTTQARHTTRLSGWRMYMLGLDTFVEFMRLLGSYFLVLQSLHADETGKTK